MYDPLKLLSADDIRTRIKQNQFNANFQAITACIFLGLGVFALYNSLMIWSLVSIIFSIVNLLTSILHSKLANLWIDNLVIAEENERQVASIQDLNPHKK